MSSNAVTKDSMCWWVWLYFNSTMVGSIYLSRFFVIGLNHTAEFKPWTKLILVEFLGTSLILTLSTWVLSGMIYHWYTGSLELENTIEGELAFKKEMGYVVDEEESIESFKFGRVYLE